MAPLSKAVVLQQIVSNDAPKRTKLYSGSVDPEWTIGSVPNGGYVLALVMEACIKFQSSTSHVDPMHITAHYIRTTSTAPFTVRVSNVRTGAGFTNITAELAQDDVVKVMAHAIFGINAPRPRDKLNLTLNPPSTYARRHPLYTNPANAIVKPLRHTWKFHKRATWTEEKEILAKNDPDGANRTNASSVGGNGIEWGAWFEFSDEEQLITNPALCFLADMCLNTPTLLPKSERVGLTTSWYPTMTLSLEFKNKIPPPSSLHAARTVAIYSQGRFMTPPQGRHEAYVEVWTAPSALGEAPQSDNWRENQVCLATATQMGLTLPMEVNERKGKSASVKL